MECCDCWLFPGEWDSQDSVPFPGNARWRKPAKGTGELVSGVGGQDRQKAEASPWGSHQKGLRHPLSIVEVERGQATSHNQQQPKRTDSGQVLEGIFHQVGKIKLCHAQASQANQNCIWPDTVLPTFNLSTQSPPDRGPNGTHLPLLSSDGIRTLTFTQLKSQQGEPK